MEVTATEAKNRLGQMLEHAQREPVVIEKSGRRHSVLISAEHYDALLSAGPQDLPRLRRPDPSRDFYTTYKEWVDMHNELVERVGLPGEEHRPW
jgi:prevent-host-death family protein